MKPARIIPRALLFLVVVDVMFSVLTSGAFLTLYRLSDDGLRRMLQLLVMAHGVKLLLCLALGVWRLHPLHKQLKQSAGEAVEQAALSQRIAYGVPVAFALVLSALGGLLYLLVALQLRGPIGTELEVNRYLFAAGAIFSLAIAVATFPPAYLLAEYLISPARPLLAGSKNLPAGKLTLNSKVLLLVMSFATAPSLWILSIGYAASIQASVNETELRARITRARVDLAYRQLTQAALSLPAIPPPSLQALTEARSVEHSAAFIADLDGNFLAGEQARKIFAQSPRLQKRFRDSLARDEVDTSRDLVTGSVFSYRASESVVVGGVATMRRQLSAIFVHSLWFFTISLLLWMALCACLFAKMLVSPIAKIAHTIANLAHFRDPARVSLVPVQSNDELGTLAAGINQMIEQLDDEMSRRAVIAADNKRLLEQTTQALAIRDRFLSIASHELNTPLTPLLLGLRNVQSAVRRGESANALQQGLEVCSRQVERLESLVKRLLDVSALTEKVSELNLQPCDLVELVRSTVLSFSLEAERRQSLILVDAPDHLPLIVDPQRLRQSIAHLLSNALKFGSGRPVKLTIFRRGAATCLDICDLGIGMTQEFQHMAFQRFARGVSATKYGGLGLGLYIARNNVEAHGGTLSLRSALGKGTCFTISIPMVSMNEKAASDN